MGTIQWGEMGLTAGAKDMEPIPRNRKHFRRPPGLKAWLLVIALVSIWTAFALANKALCQGHPYLFLDEPDIAELRAEANNPASERYHIFQAIKAAVDANINGGGSCHYFGITSYALCYLITGDAARYAEPAKECMLSLAGEPEWEGGKRDRTMAIILLYYAMGYDWLANYLQPIDKTTIRDKLALETFKTYEAASGPHDSTWQNWWTHCYSQNHFHRDVGGMLMGALALRYEGNELTDYSQADVDGWIAFGREERVFE